MVLIQMYTFLGNSDFVSGAAEAASIMLTEQVPPKFLGLKLKSIL